MTKPIETQVPPATVAQIYKHGGDLIQLLHAMPRHATKSPQEVRRIMSGDMSDYSQYEPAIEYGCDLALDTARLTLISALQAYMAVIAIHRLTRPEVEPHA